MSKGNLFLVINILILLILTVGGCSKKSTSDEAGDAEPSPVDQERALIEENITDPDKRAKLNDILNNADDILREFSQERSRFQQELKLRVSNYNVTKAEIKDLIKDFNIKYENFYKSMISHRMDLIDLTTPQEWKKISDIEKTTLTN